MKYALFVISILIIFSCGKKEKNNLDCKSIIVDNALYKTASKDTTALIKYYNLQDNCLEMTINAGGCNPEVWDVELIFSDVYMESLPMQTRANIQIKNQGACLAYFEKTISFDISEINEQLPLIVNVENAVGLNLTLEK